MVDLTENQEVFGKLWTPVTIGIAIVLITMSILFILKAFSVRKRTFLILGLNDAGKTILFSKLINKNLDPHTYTSLKENVFHGYRNVYGKELNLVDYPGAERLRKQLFSRYFEKNRNAIRGVIFVVDSSTFSKKVRDVAEFLYDTLRESPKGTSFLVACNKQDIQLAKSSQAIHNALEREIGLINSSRSAALETTDGSNAHRVLTTTGKNFQWTDLPKIKVEFLDCCADKEYQVENGSILGPEIVQRWIDGVKI